MPITPRRVNNAATDLHELRKRSAILILRHQLAIGATILTADELTRLGSGVRLGAPATLFVVGARVLFVISRALFISRSLSIERLAVSLFQATIATLFLVAAFGTIRWETWGRSLAIPVCAWSAFATIFLTRLPANYRFAGLIFCAALVLLIIWFYLPKVKLQFITAKGQLAPPPD